MSREQWGHGFWNGVRQKEAGMVSSDDDYESIKCRLAYKILLSAHSIKGRQPRRIRYVICDYFKSDYYDAESEREIVSALWYITENQLCNCYIGGSDGDNIDYQNDYLCFGGYSNNDIIAEMQNNGICNQMWKYDDNIVMCPFCNTKQYKIDIENWKYCPICGKRLYKEAVDNDK